MNKKGHAVWMGLSMALAVAASAAAQVAPEGTVTVAGDSNVRSWTCGTGTLQGSLGVVEGAALALDGLGQAVRTLDVRIPVAGLDCRNGTMNDHMWKALRRETHPEIHYRMTGYSVTPAGPESAVVDVRGELTLAGSTRPHALTLIATPLDEGGIRVQGNSAIDMTDFGVEPPRAMLGALRVREDVVVTLDLRLQPQGASR